jgi:hypothetical protein
VPSTNGKDARLDLIGADLPKLSTLLEITRDCRGFNDYDVEVLIRDLAHCRMRQRLWLLALSGRLALDVVCGETVFRPVDADEREVREEALAELAAVMASGT